MIDSITLSIPYSLASHNAYSLYGSIIDVHTKSKFNDGSRHAFEVIDSNLFDSNINLIFNSNITGPIHSSLRSKRKYNSSKSYHPRVTITKHRQKINLKVVVSLPKLFFGNNLEELNQFDFAFVVCKLRDALEEVGIYTTVDILSTANVTSIHYSKVFLLSRHDKISQDCGQLINILSQSDFNQRYDVTTKEFKSDARMVSFYNQQQQITFYDKTLELKNDLERKIVNDVKDIAKEDGNEPDNNESERKHLSSSTELVKKFLQEYGGHQVLKMEVKLFNKRKIIQLIKKETGIELKNEEVILARLYNDFLSKTILTAIFDKIKSVVSSYLLSNRYENILNQLVSHRRGLDEEKESQKSQEDIKNNRHLLILGNFVNSQGNEERGHGLTLGSNEYRSDEIDDESLQKNQNRKRSNKKLFLTDKELFFMSKYLELEGQFHESWIKKHYLDAYKSKERIVNKYYNGSFEESLNNKEREECNTIVNYLYDVLYNFKSLRIRDEDRVFESSYSYEEEDKESIKEGEQDHDEEDYEEDESNLNEENDDKNEYNSRHNKPIDPDLLRHHENLYNVNIEEVRRINDLLGILENLWETENSYNYCQGMNYIEDYTAFSFRSDKNNTQKSFNEFLTSVSLSDKEVEEQDSSIRDYEFQDSDLKAIDKNLIQKERKYQELKYQEKINQYKDRYLKRLGIKVSKDFVKEVEKKNNLPFQEIIYNYGSEENYLRSLLDDPSYFKNQDQFEQYYSDFIAFDSKAKNTRDKKIKAIASARAFSKSRHYKRMQEKLFDILDKKPDSYYNSLLQKKIDKEIKRIQKNQTSVTDYESQASEGDEFVYV